DEVIGPLGHGEDGVELRLAPHLEPDPVALAVGDDLLDHVALLVDLDGVHGRVAALEAELFDGGLEALGQGLDARAQDVREAEEHRHADALLLEVHGELEEVQAPARIPGRVDRYVSLLVDVEVPDSPPVNVVQLAGVVDRPSHFATASWNAHRADSPPVPRRTKRGPLSRTAPRLHKFGSYGGLTEGLAAVAGCGPARAAGPGVPPVRIRPPLG